ncbi:MAG: DinB family protein, partial [Acidobacteriia bacterium]|nr:DinB family protein [Terriglobia bacterium]
MNEITRIRGLYKSVCVGPAWHGPSLAENLKGVTAQQAAAHPIAGSHSIWEIVNHISAWEYHVVAALAGAGCPTLQGDDDWPPVTDPSEAAWAAAVAKLDAGNKALGAAMRSFPEEKLGETVPGRDFRWYVL